MDEFTHKETTAPLAAPPSASPPPRTERTLPRLGALEAAARQISVQCNVVVTTAIFVGAQMLRQPQYCRERKAQNTFRRAQRPAQAGGRVASAEVCHVAFVDWQSERLLKHHLE